MRDPYIHRKEIAHRCRVSPDTVARREKQWGIAAAKDRVCLKPARYRADHPAVRRLLEDHPDE